MSFFKIIIVIAFVAPFKTFAQTPQPALITVSGKGQIKIVPDIVNINLGIETTDVTLSVAKARNDWKLNEILNFLKESGIESKDIATNRIELNDRKMYERRHNLPDTTITKYYSSQSMTLTLRDINAYGRIVEGLLEKGLSQIQNVYFTSSKIDSLRRDARLQAIRDARQKATEMAAEVGQKIGNVYNMTEGNQPIFSSEGFTVRGSRPSETQIRVDGLEVSDQFAEGEIAITQYVTVSFYLK
jgi:uncharacterized protein YggE